MDEVLEFFKKVKTYFLATVDGEQPEIRPFGTICKYQDKLYIQTGKVKDCYKQMEANPRISICGFDGETGTWVRVDAIAEMNDDYDAVDAMLNEYPHLRKMYAPGDGNSVIVALTQEPHAFARSRQKNASFASSFYGNLITIAWGFCCLSDKAPLRCAVCGIL